MEITNGAIEFLQKLLLRGKRAGIRIGYNERSMWGISNFKLTLDEFQTGDYQIEKNGLKIFYREDVLPHISSLVISYENGRLSLRDNRRSC